MSKARKSNIVLILLLTTVFALSAMLGCAGKSSEKEITKEETGSLVREFTLMDEQGRRSGKLIINLSGKAELKDASGKTIAEFSLSEGASVPPAEKPAETDKVDVKADDTAEVKADDTADVKADDTAEVKADDKTEVKADDKTEVKADDKTEVKADDKTEVKADDTADEAKE